MYYGGDKHLMDAIEQGAAKVRLNAFGGIDACSGHSEEQIKAARSLLHALLHMFSETTAAYHFFDPAASPQLCISALGPALAPPALEGYGLVRIPVALS